MGRTFPCDRGGPPSSAPPPSHPWISTAQYANVTPYVVAGILFILVTIPLARFTDALSRRSGWLEAMGGVAGVACRDDRPWRRRPREPVTDVGPAAADAGRVLERGVPVQVLGDPAEQRTRDFLRRLS